jgi:hypothetical protein
LYKFLVFSDISKQHEKVLLLNPNLLAATDHWVQATSSAMLAIDLVEYLTTQFVNGDCQRWWCRGSRDGFARATEQVSDEEPNGGGATGKWSPELLW